MINFIKICISFVYCAAVNLRNKLYDWKILKSVEFEDIPTIVIGNITVGGTGKTPHSEYILNLLQNEFKVALLSRGYKRSTSGFHYVETSSTAREVGDEPLQIKRKFPNLVVAVDANRIRGINKIKKDFENIDVVILDDAFQYRKLKPALSILLCDYWRPLSKDKMLPVGNLRDTRSQISRADVIIITKCPEQAQPIDIRVAKGEISLMAYQDLYLSSFEYGKLIPVFGTAQLPQNIQKVVGISGIGNPKPFEDYLLSEWHCKYLQKYPDHHKFTEDEMAEIRRDINNNDLLITTEKDTMRLVNYKKYTDAQKAKMFYVPIKVKIIENEEDKFNKFIIDYVRKNKRNSFLHTK